MKDIDLDQYPNFKTEEDTERYIKNLIKNYDAHYLKDLEAEWELKSLSKQKIDKFERTYEKVLEEDVESLLESSKQQTVDSFKYAAYGTAIGTMAGVITGDMEEWFRRGCSLGIMAGVLSNVYSVHMETMHRVYKERMDQVKEKFIKEPLNKLYG